MTGGGGWVDFLLNESPRITYALAFYKSHKIAPKKVLLGQDLVPCPPGCRFAQEVTPRYLEDRAGCLRCHLEYDKYLAFNAATNLSEVTMCNAWKDRYENACKAFYKEKEELLHPEWFNTVERMDPLTPTGVLDSWFVDETSGYSGSSYVLHTQLYVGRAR